AHYEQGTYNNHEPKRQRKLLLNKQELKKLKGKLKDKGLTIIPTRLFISDSGHAKLNIALAKGKKIHDKRDGIKDRDIQRDVDRALNR
ncbi:MAG: SsrA-binding protein, partial [Flavobacteriales bacterium]